MSFSPEKFYVEHSAPGMAREIAVIREVLKGNQPDWAKTFVKIGSNEVALDYVTVGTNDDFVRTPLTAPAAQFLADKLGYAFPTPHLVDLTAAQADTRLPPMAQGWWQGHTKGIYNMQYGPNYFEHHVLLEAARAGRGGLIAGGKKDVIKSFSPSRLCIYGWQRNTENLDVIQPASDAHDVNWCDYSQGIRFCRGPDTGRAYDGPILKQIEAELAKPV